MSTSGITRGTAPDARGVTVETTAALERHLRILGTRNLRDVGGYPAGEGRQTRWRTLLRGDALDRLPPSSQRALIELGVRTVIDLRRPDELESNPDVFRDSPDVRYRHLAMFDVDQGEGPDGIIGWYRSAVDRYQDRLVGVVRALLEPDAVPAVVHCAAGKDRTGITVGLVLAAVGVPHEVIVEDYGLTKASFAIRWVEAEDEPGGIGQVVDDSEPAVDAPPELMQAVLERLYRRYGGAAGYLRAAGLTDEDLGRLRELLTEPT